MNSIEGVFRVSEHNFDLVVLGGGSAGYAAAIRAVQLGSTVALVEKDKLGGTCLHRGCVPTKAMLHAAELADNAHEAASVGVLTEFQGVDIVKVNAFREGIVASKFKGLQGLLKAKGVTVFQGEGKLVSPRPSRSETTRSRARTSCLRRDRSPVRFRGSRSRATSSRASRHSSSSGCRTASSSSVAVSSAWSSPAFGVRSASRSRSLRAQAPRTRRRGISLQAARARVQEARHRLQARCAIQGRDAGRLRRSRGARVR